MHKYICALGFIALSVSSANAQWMSNTEPDPFGGDKTSISFTVSMQGYVFGFRCHGKDDYRIVYLTTEAFGKPGSTLPGVVLKVRVDNSEPVDFPADIDESNGKLRLSADHVSVLPFMHTIAAAKDRVAVAVEVGGQRFHTQSFGTSGSRTAINQSMKACGLDPTKPS